MTRFIRWLEKLSHSAFAIPLLLLMVCILSYGSLIPWLGYYSDDWIFIWSFSKMGSEGLTRYFSTNRPFLNGLFQLTMPLVGIAPWRWQIFALITRWLTGLSAWWLIRLIWSKKQSMAAWTALLICVYPALVSQPVALTGSHLYLVLALLFSSFALNILAIRQPKKFLPLTLLAFAASAVNLLTLEYFYMLELLRPLIILMVLNDKKHPFWHTIKRVSYYFAPYLVLFFGVSIWRAFFFGYQDFNHPALLITQLKADPIQALIQLPGAFLKNIWISSVAAWARPFAFHTLAGIGRTATMAYLVLVPASTILVILFGYSSIKDPTKNNKAGLEPGILGLVCLALAGIPFLVTGLVPDLWTFSSRFNLPFMLGACLVLVTIIFSIPLKSWLRVLLFSIFIGFCIGQQFVISNQYRLDWYLQNRFYRQLTWRIPQLEQGTLIVANDFPSSLGGASAYTSAINWLYAPENSSAQMSYAFVYGTEKPGLLNGQLTELDYLSGKFNIDYRKTLFINYNNRCLQVLSPQYGFEYPYLEPRLLGMPALSNIDLIHLEESKGAALDERIFSTDSSQDWCYYAIKADRARQQGDWQEVANLGEEGIPLFGKGEDRELFLFIEANAIIGNWDRAIDLLEEAARISLERNKEIYFPTYQGLWKFIDECTPPSPQKEAAHEAWQEIMAPKP